MTEETAEFPLEMGVPLEAHEIKTDPSTIFQPTACDESQIECQKKKRQKRLQPIPTSSIHSDTTCNLEALIDLPSSDLAVNDEGNIVSSTFSELPECIPLLAGSDQLPGIEIPPHEISKLNSCSAGYEVEVTGDDVVEASLSKAATRMRKYRADHRHDVAWLAKEAERMRNMRAARKAGAGGMREEKPKKEKAVRKKREKISILGDLAPVEKFNHEEYLRKEAERVRKYRALKQLDPEWKKNDSDRMRLYRAKRKLDAGLKAAAAPLPEADINLGVVVEQTQAVVDIVPPIPQHQLILGALADEIKADDTDSEDEAQV
jgi:hypothetical protein